MSRQIQFTYNDKEYTLEFTRNSVREMEARGFSAAQIADKPMTILPQLFAGAFLARHPGEKPAVIEEIYRKMPNKRELIARLADMYSEPVKTLLDDPEDGSGNIVWTSNWENGSLSI